MKVILLLLLLFPLIGSFINIIWGRLLPRRAVEAVACLALAAGFAMALAGFIKGFGTTSDVTLFDWFSVGPLVASMNLHYDPLAEVMALMVTFVATIIHLYSVFFMRADDDYVRYFAFLNLFVFSMLVITLADSLVFVYLGWEGVGFCSYALIGFWYTDVQKTEAGRKAFVMTRIGDIAFGIALAIIFVQFRTFSITGITPAAAALSPGTATLLTLLLLWAAAGKSAQLPLTTWLPDAMAGPTPVSALIHAATMVTAGVYLLMRLFPVVHQSPAGMAIIAGIGAVTAFYASLAALFQKDIKRVLAYSTISQVGYMILAVGAGDIAAGMFHLLSHAFFKSLLFLAAGIIIQALAEEHDIFKMGNLRRLLPGAFWLMLAGSLCLAAFPTLGGYFSKDRILLSTFVHGGAAYKVFWALGMTAACLTSLYTFRMFFIAFLDRPDGRSADEIQPVPGFMVAVLVPLAVLALADGLLNLPLGPGKQWLSKFLSPVPGVIIDINAPFSLLLTMGLISASASLLGIILAYFIFRRARAPQTGFWHDLLFSAFYLDTVYRHIFVRPYQWMARMLWQAFDEGVIDAAIENSAVSVASAGSGIQRWTTGKLSTYLKAFFWGLAGILCIFFGITYIW